MYLGITAQGAAITERTKTVTPAIQDQKHAEHAFVDPEIGPMGAAARQAGIRFGYLHVISNNLARRYPADLSNERHDDVIRRRTVLVGRIRNIITNRLAACPN